MHLTDQIQSRWDAVSQSLAHKQYSRIMRPEVDQTALHAFQDTWRVTIPEDYAYFLEHIGDGGPGPYYGIFPLKACTLLEADQHTPDSNPVPDTLRHVHDSLLATEFPPDADGVMDMKCLERMGINYGHVPGSIAVSNYGCGGVLRLIVSGAHKGSIWLDLLIDGHGIHLQSPSFLAWYEQWLSGDLPTLWKSRDFIDRAFY